MVLAVTFYELVLVVHIVAAIVAVLLGLGGAYFRPRERRLAELAERDVGASGGGEVEFSDEYQRLNRQVAMVGVVSYVLIIAAVWVMVTKPGI